MRLTNVAHLRLPFGRLFGYDVTVEPTGRDLPISVDQRRHIGDIDRPGTWMAISFTLPAPVDRERLSDAWLQVVRRHGTLHSVFETGPDGPRLEDVEVRPGVWRPHPVLPGQAINDALRDVLDAACSPFARPSHRLCVLETATGPTVVIAADHSHVDMWSMLVIVRDLLAVLAQSGTEHSAGTPVLPPARDFADHTRELRDRPAAPPDVHRRWAEVLAAGDDVMPRFPLPLGAPEASLERVEVRDVFDVDDSAAFSAQARADGVSTLALAVSAMTAVTREIADAPLRAVFPVHSRYDPAWHDSVGWFITNSVLESRDPEPAAAGAAVKEAIRLGSWPLEEILAPWGGMPEAPGMFAISWLDLRRLPVRVDSYSLGAQYVGASIRTDGVMLWFILDDAGLHLRCRYPDTMEARDHVGAWLDGLVERMRAMAGASTADLLTVAGRTYRVQRATRGDVPGILALLTEDEFAGERETDARDRYEAAFDVISRDRAHYLAVVRNSEDRIVATVQLTIIPGLIRGGTTRLHIEGLRVAVSERSRGLGAALLGWAHQHGRTHGAGRAQVSTDAARDPAHRFYRALGYDSTHIGFTRPL